MTRWHVIPDRSLLILVAQEAYYLTVKGEKAQLHAMMKFFGLGNPDA
jgi:hypothetical protein